MMCLCVHTQGKKEYYLLNSFSVLDCIAQGCHGGTACSTAAAPGFL